MNIAEGQPSIRLVVVGGGTAGWLSALILQSEAKHRQLPITITLVESSKIPTIGVGEGTTSIFGGVLQALGINEADFLKKTDATIKYGIRHRDWRRLGHVYDGPIDDPYMLVDKVPGAESWLDAYCIAAGRSVAEPHLFAALMRDNKAPVAKLDGRYVPLSRFHHAYHFDQAKVGAYLRSKAQGIEHIDALVKSAEQDPETGEITGLHLDDDMLLEGDFFVDCTGFRRALIGEVMGADWVSYGDVLPVNRAMPFWLEHEGDEIPTYTHAWAQKSGWMWQIPTQERMGCGYVYSDRHTTPDAAQAEIEAVLGRKIEPRNDIKIDAGRLSETWRGNVLALGLSSSFLEPLEATSIHGTIVTTLLFAKRHLGALTNVTTEDRTRFNAAIAGQVDDFRDFINLHYVSEREDSAFWRDVSSDYIQPSTRDRLAHWAHNLPKPSDFRNDLDALPHVETLLHYPVLDGLGLLNREVARREMKAMPSLQKFARENVDFLQKQARDLSGRAMSHRAWLEALVEE